jgi:hypothetical protein
MIVPRVGPPIARGRLRYLLPWFVFAAVAVAVVTTTTLWSVALRTSAAGRTTLDGAGIDVGAVPAAAPSLPSIAAPPPSAVATTTADAVITTLRRPRPRVLAPPPAALPSRAAAATSAPPPPAPVPATVPTTACVESDADAATCASEVPSNASGRSTSAVAAARDLVSGG